VKIDVVKNKSWTEILKMAQDGELGMISDINKTPDREQYLSFTEPYLSNPVIIIDNGGFIDTVEKGYFIQELLAHDHPEIQLIPAENVHEALRMVSNDEVELILEMLHRQTMR
jgi:ABC-type amino acid transport substrate-binding protein